MNVHNWKKIKKVWSFVLILCLFNYQLSANITYGHGKKSHAWVCTCEIVYLSIVRVGHSFESCHWRISCLFVTFFSPILYRINQSSIKSIKEDKYNYDVTSWWHGKFVSIVSFISMGTRPQEMLSIELNPRYDLQNWFVKVQELREKRTWMWLDMGFTFTWCFRSWEGVYYDSIVSTISIIYIMWITLAGCFAQKESNFFFL